MMIGYWNRHRLFQTIILSVVVAIVAGLLFVVPVVNQQAGNYNSQSIYKNTDIDFIVPEPSFEQVAELPGTNGINEVFPFYLTNTTVTVGNQSRSTYVILSDQYENINMTMYNDRRVIEASTDSFSNPIMVDWQFCYDTGAEIGDTVSFPIGGSNVEYQISAIYETNSLYDGGAIFAPITPEQKESISRNSKSNGYTAIYVSASDYNTCQAYLKSDYRPLGRLKDRDQFDSDEQYKIHYDAIMSSGYANEITDFRIKENSGESQSNALMLVLGAVLVVAAILVFNLVMAKRGCEKAYFTKRCIPQGTNVKPYYMTAFLAESLLSFVFYVCVMVLSIKSSSEYIPNEALGFKLAVIPIAIVMAEIVALCLNYSEVSRQSRIIEARIKKEKEEAERKALEQNALQGNEEITYVNTDKDN